MKTARTTPKLRFAGFTEAWKEDRLSKFFSSSRAKGRDGIPTLSVTLDRGLVDRSELDRKMETNLGPDEHLLVRKDDIAYNMMRMWQGAFGRADVEGMVSPAYVVLRPLSASHPAFFEYAFRRNRAIYLFWAYSYGITNDRLRLYADDFLRIPFRAPKVSEQQKIAAFLTAVDGRIEQLSRKKALLEATKKGVMQQLFTQTLRFQDDDGHDFPDWEEKTLGEIATVTGGGTPESEVDEYWGGDVLWFTPTEIRSKYVCGSKRTITAKGLKNSSAKLLPTGTLLFTSRATIAEVSIATKECTTNQGFQSLVVNGEANNEFVYYWIHQHKKEFLRKAQGSTFLEIGPSEMRKMLLRLPSLPEQTKIAGFLSALDGKIAAVGEQMRQTQAWKKGLLQQMFV